MVCMATWLFVLYLVLAAVGAAVAANIMRDRRHNDGPGGGE